LQSFNDGAPACPTCSRTEVKRLVSGFYRARAEGERISEAASKLAVADDSSTGTALAEVGRAYDEDLSHTMTAMYEADQEGV